MQTTDVTKMPASPSPGKTTSTSTPSRATSTDQRTEQAVNSREWLRSLVAEADAVLSAGGCDSWAEDADLIRRLRDVVALLCGPVMVEQQASAPNVEPMPELVVQAGGEHGLWWIDNSTDSVLGQQLRGVLLENVHPESACAGRACCLHNPSEHPLRSAPLNWRGDRRMMERICEHGISHDDPDDLAYRRSIGADSTGAHGCCRIAPGAETSR